MTEPHQLAHAADPETSRDAAAIAALSPTSARVKLGILSLLRAFGPQAHWELAELYFEHAEGNGWPHRIQRHTVARRASDLRNAGLIRDSGMRANTPDGHVAVRWIAVPQYEYGDLVAAATRAQQARDAARRDLTMLIARGLVAGELEIDQHVYDLARARLREYERSQR